MAGSSTLGIADSRIEMTFSRGRSMIADKRTSSEVICFRYFLSSCSGLSSSI
jgi:hypothetical protein